MDAVEKPGKTIPEGSGFPSFVPPFMVKELRQGLRTQGFVWFLILFPLLMAVPFLLHAVLGDRVIGRAVIDFVFWLGAVCVFFVYNPLRALSSVSREKSTGTADLIVLTRLTPYSIIRQKWMSVVVQTLLLAVLILPFYLLRYLLGGAEIVLETVGLSVLFILSCTFSALALWVSGMPVVYRVFYCLGLVYCGGVAIIRAASEFLFPGTTFSSSLSLPGGTPLNSLLGGLSIVMMVLYVLLLCRAFLFLAARWFAPPSENTDFGFRMTLFRMIGLIFVFFLLSWFTSSSQAVAEANVAISRTILSGVAALCVLDMVWPRPLKLAHWKKLKAGGGWGRRLSLLFLPGWQGAALVMLCAGCVCMLIGVVSALAGGQPGLVEPCARAALLVCANSLFLGVVFQPLYQRTGQYALLIYVVIATALTTIMAVWIGVAQMLPDKDFYLSLLAFVPRGSSMVQELISNKAGGVRLNINWNESLVFWGNWTLIIVNFLIFLLGLFPFLRKVRRLEKTDSPTPS